MREGMVRLGLGLELIGKDLLYGIRKLRNDYLFTLISVITLTLGLGTNAALFNLIYKLEFRSLPVPHPEELFRIGLDFSGRDIPLSGPLFDALQRHRDKIPGTMAWTTFGTFLQANDRSQSLDGALISGNGFSVLRLQPELGRLLKPFDDVPGGGPGGFTAVISDRLWKSHFDRSSSVLSRRLLVNGISVAIVGVMPPKFTGMVVGSSPDIVLPLEFEAKANGALSQRHFAGATWLMVFGRRKTGVPFASVDGRVQILAPAIIHEGLETLPASDQNDLLPHLKLRLYPGYNGTSGELSYHDGGLRDLYKKPLLAMQSLACFLLLLCVINLMALQVARNKAREQEFAIRTSLGARRVRIWSQLILENLLLGVTGSILSIVFAYILQSGLARFLASQQEYWLSLDTTTDTTVTLTVLWVGTSCMLFAGVIPAIYSTSAGFTDAFRGSLVRGSMANTTITRIERFLIPLQVSLCMILLVSGGLFLSTVLKLLTVPMGFDPKNVVLFSFDSGSDKDALARKKLVQQRVVERLRSTHGVSAAAVLDVAPIGGGMATTPVRSTESGGRTDRNLAINGVGPSFLTVMHTRLLQGREFRSTDALNSPPVCMLTISAAKYFFPSVSPLGQHLGLLPPRPPLSSPECEVIGVTEDSKYNDLRAIAPRLLYVNVAQSPFPVHYIIARTSNLRETTLEFERIMHQESPGSRMTEPKLLSDQIRNSMGRERLLGLLSIVFAVLATLVTGVGLYGFLSWSVVQRTSEIGIRMALGADPRAVFWMIGKQTLRLLAAGVVVGAIGSYLIAQLARSMLYATAATDPIVFSAAVVIVLILGLFATWIPARRAAFLEPIYALRRIAH